MKKRLSPLVIIGLSLTSAASIAQPPTASPGPKRNSGPCQSILAACESAGFVKGQAKAGTGLYADCVQPIIQGQPNPRATKALPNVEPNVVAACKTARPNFGEGKPRGTGGAAPAS